MNHSSESLKNSEIEYIKQSLLKEFPNIKFIEEGPNSKPDDRKTNVVGKVWNYYIKGFTRTGKILGKTECELIQLFNKFSEEKGSRFSGPIIMEEGEKEGGYFFRMENIKGGGKQKLDFSKMTLEEIMKLYDEYRQTFDEFEKYSNGKISTESDPTLQKIYSLSKNNLLFNLAGNSVLKAAIAKKYKNKINEQISNGQCNVRSCGVNIEREKINRTLNGLLSKVKRFDFEYNFGSWTGYVFSDGENYKFVDFGNVGYQIKGTELLGIMGSNLLMSAGDYKSYEDWKTDYNKWYERLLGRYEDKNLVKLLLFIKLIGTVFEDYGNLIYKKEVGGGNEGQKNGNFEKVKKGIEWNYKVLQELMGED